MAGYLIEPSRTLIPSLDFSNPLVIDKAKISELDRYVSLNYYYCGEEIKQSSGVIILNFPKGFGGSNVGWHLHFKDCIYKEDGWQYDHSTFQYTLTGIQLVGPYGTEHKWYDNIYPSTAIKGLSHHYNISSLDLAYDTGDFGDADYQSMPWYGLFWIQSYEELQL